MSEERNNLRERILYTTPTDDRSRMRAVANNLILHLHPTKVPKPALRFTYTWGLGGISAVLIMLLIFTGVILMFRYDASVERAYTSIQFLETQVPFGSLLRSLHHWAANLLIITTFLHLMRVFYTGGFMQGRSTNWQIGILLLLLVITFNFTGYLLPWDQLAFWAITVATSLLSYVPLIGNGIANFLLGGPEVGQSTLRNFYAIHVAVLPAFLLVLLSYHFWKVRKDGGITQPEPEPEEGRRQARVERVTTIPHLVQIELAATAVLITGLVLFAILVPAPLEALADPTHPPNPAKAAWYFLGLQELLLHMHPLAAMLLPVIILGALVAIPYWDKQDDRIGHYFRSRIGRKTAIWGTLLAVLLIPYLVILDEWWLDLPGWLPGWPTLITNGLIPLLLSLGALYLIFRLMRRAFKATRSEAAVGIYTFIFTSLVLLTVIGVFFRGANMALIWPFA